MSGEILAKDPENNLQITLRRHGLRRRQSQLLMGQ